MLIRAMVENFKSFCEPTELVMVSSSRIRRKESHVRKLNGAKVLKYAAVYGANAAGKSNLVDFFAFVQQVLIGGLDTSSGGLFCRNDESNRERPSSFEVQFSVGERTFAYGFTAVLFEMRVLEEWLYELRASRTIPLLVVDASSSAPITAGIDFTDLERARFQTYADDFAYGSSGLFLSELNRSKRYAQDSRFRVFADAYRWLTEGIVVVASTLPQQDARYLTGEGGLERVGRLLSSFDTGIAEVCPEPISQEGFAGAVGVRTIDQIRMDATERLRESCPGKIRGCCQTRDGLYLYDVDRGGMSNICALRLRHRGTTSLFDFSEESDGTRRLFDLMGMLLDDAEDTAYVVDDLERSLHPMLVRHFLELFMESNANRSCQIVFSSHEASIMDPELFRRDEIWFVDRGADGSSGLYSLDRFKDRFDKDIAKAYLEGRYGAVPAFTEYEEE